MQTTEVAKSLDAIITRAGQEGVPAAGEHTMLLPYGVTVDYHPWDFLKHSGGQAAHGRDFEAGANDDQAITGVKVMLE